MNQYGLLTGFIAVKQTCNLSNGLKPLVREHKPESVVYVPRHGRPAMRAFWRHRYPAAVVAAQTDYYHDNYWCFHSAYCCDAKPGEKALQ